MQKKQNFLFLDIDGVLNCTNTNTFYDIGTPDSYGIDEQLWSNLQKFLNEFPNLKVVIHSGWTKHKDNPNYEWNLNHPELGIKIKTKLPDVIQRLGNRYFDCVPYIKGKPKKTRIEKWLTDNNLSLSNCQCLVIDDDRSQYTDLKSLEKYPNITVYFTDKTVGLDNQCLNDILEIGKSIFS